METDCVADITKLQISFIEWKKLFWNVHCILILFLFLLELANGRLSSMRKKRIWNVNSSWTISYSRAHVQSLFLNVFLCRFSLLPNSSGSKEMMLQSFKIRWRKKRLTTLDFIFVDHLLRNLLLPNYDELSVIWCTDWISTVG